MQLALIAFCVYYAGTCLTCISYAHDQVSSIKGHFYIKKNKLSVFSAQMQVQPLDDSSC